MSLKSTKLSNVHENISSLNHMKHFYSLKKFENKSLVSNSQSFEPQLLIWSQAQLFLVLMMLVICKNTRA